MLYLLILLITVYSTPLLSFLPEDNAVDECENEARSFTENEDQYAEHDYEILKGYRNDGFPTVLGVPRFSLILQKYEKEVRQRPFECLTEKLNASSEWDFETYRKYTELAFKCKSQQEILICNHKNNFYREFDGTCNNRRNPNWGSSLNCLRRMVPAHYEGVSGFRKSKTGALLPDPRYLSSTFTPGKNPTSVKVTSMFAMFGQALAHDIADVSLSSVRSWTMDCCANRSRGALHPQCAPIYISSDDSFYSKYNIDTCFSFIRAAPCDTCSMGKRNQMNEVTSYIDASLVYGTDSETAKNIRNLDGTGKLTAQYRKAGELLPPDDFLGETYGSTEKHQFCFLSGDRRVTQHTPLMSLQTLFLREHNRIAEILKQLNPMWSEETLYQAARKIFIAELQVIVYKEFLPLLIGPDLMKRYNLAVLKQERTRYDEQTDATLYTEFSTAAYRLHSIVNGGVLQHAIDVNITQLRNMYLRASPIYDGDMDFLMKGMSQWPAQYYDRFVTDDLWNFTYRVSDLPGLDITTINIHRGRDNGLAPYTEFVKHIFKTDIRSFDELEKFMGKENVELLKELYSDVGDIDLWVGMNNELVPDGMVVGPTAAEVIAIQFKNLKEGDYFYFEHSGFPPQFSDDQLQSLRNVTFSSLLCKNTNISSLQQNLMALPDDFNNPTVPCSDISELDLSLWKA